ncbi:MAG: hypothetical protein AAGG75_09665 [Bacteroidota bacterium]
MKQSKLYTQNACFLMLLLLNTGIAYGQVKLSGLVLSTGIEHHEFNDRNFDGTSLKFRYFKGFDTTPIIAFGIDSRYTFSEIETPSNTISANTFSIGPIVMVSLPLKWFSIPVPKGAPEGGGPLFYVGYNFIDNTRFDDLADTKIKGDSFKIGTQLGFPVADWLVLGLAVEYSTYIFNDDDPNPLLFENANNLSRSGWEYSLVIGFPIL